MDECLRQAMQTNHVELYYSFEWSETDRHQTTDINYSFIMFHSD